MEWWRGRPVYGKNWTRKSRQMKECYHHTCQKCGRVMNGFDKESVQVHHVDGNPQNCFYWNLIVLCPPCHVKAERVLYEKERLIKNEP